MAESQQLEAAGKYLEAAAKLRPVAEAFPQDFGTQLWLAWQYYQGQAYTEDNVK